SWGGADGEKARQSAARISWRRGLASLDAAAVDRAAQALAGEEAKRARAQARELKSRAPSEVKKLVATLRLGLRSEDELVRALSDANDPRERWLAAAEMGAAGSTNAISQLAAVAGEGRIAAVRTAAFQAALAVADRAG